MNILFIGDVFGKSGRQIVKKELPQIIKDNNLNLIIANVENICHGKGTRQKDIDFLKGLGVEVFTGGNHTFDNPEILDIFKKETTVLRPANYPKSVPGNGYCIHKNTLVINLMGRVFIKEGMDSPFDTADKILEENKNKKFDAIIVDIHAETTSEKSALFHYLNGRVSAVVGTHTHIQTADEKVSKQGTAFITDVGMTGPEDSIIGMDKDIVLKKFLTGMPVKMEPATGKALFCGILIEMENKRSKSIKRIMIRE